MDSTDLIFTLVSCIFFMALVAWVSYIKTRGEVDTQEGYFLAGRGLTAIFIAGSMLLTNLSAEQLIGLNGSAYGFNLSSIYFPAALLGRRLHDTTPVS
jgi:SSS family solute:Na+ symporter